MEDFQFDSYFSNGRFNHQLVSHDMVWCMFNVSKVIYCVHFPNFLLNPKNCVSTFWLAYCQHLKPGVPFSGFEYGGQFIPHSTVATGIWQRNPLRGVGVATCYWYSPSLASSMELSKWCLGGGFKYFLISTTIFEEMIPNLTSTFFKGVGWNHQPVMFIETKNAPQKKNIRNSSITGDFHPLCPGSVFFFHLTYTPYWK